MPASSYSWQTISVALMIQQAKLKAAAGRFQTGSSVGTPRSEGAGNPAARQIEQFAEVKYIDLNSPSALA